MSSRRTGRKLYVLSMVGLLSVLCGALVAGLLLPGALILGMGARHAANALERLPAELTLAPQMQRSRILLKDGSTLAEFYDQNRVYDKLADISPLMQKAQVAIEDNRFYEHGPIYLQGTLRALVRNSAGGATQGGSTLTQQYVKQSLIENALANNDPHAVADAQAQTLTRKVRELRYSIAIEKRFTKDEILERYLNIAYYGDNSYGVEAAARHYFDTTAQKLTLDQAAMLAGIVQNPTAFNPVVHPQASMHRRNIVLNRMAQLHVVTQAQADAAKQVVFTTAHVRTANKGCFGTRFPFICQYAYNTIINSMTSLGHTRQERIDALNRDGLTIRTVIDPAAQTRAQDALSSYVAGSDPVIAVGATIEPSTGLITSMAQNRHQMGSGKGQTWINYAVEPSMGGAEGFQAGSTFKAFTMAAALAKGMSASGTFYDAPKVLNLGGQQFAGCQGNVTWRTDIHNSTPQSGRMNMITAARYSVNTYFAQLELHAGLCASEQMADAAGVHTASGSTLADFNQPSFTLGSAEVTPLSMASAYATFANHGVHCDPIILASAITQNGRTAAVPPANCRQVMPAGVANGVTAVLRQVMLGNATGEVARIPGRQYQAGKTGTTDSHEAVWFDGYTPQMAGVGMIAADKMDPRFRGQTSRSITGLYVHGTSCSQGCQVQGHGGTDAGAHIWRPMMDAVLQGLPDTPFTGGNQASTPDSGLTPADDPSTTATGTVPDVSGLSSDAARARLQAAG